MKKKPTLAIIALAVSQIFCGLLSQSPERVAREWYEAYFAQDPNVYMDLTCEREKSALQMEALFGAGLSGLTQYFGGVEMDIDADLSDLEFETKSIEDNMAIVEVTGLLQATVMGVYQEYHVNEVVTLIQVDGDWKYCGRY